MVKIHCELMVLVALGVESLNVSSGIRNQAINIRNSCDRSLVITTDSNQVVGTLQPGQSMQQWGNHGASYHAFWTLSDVGKTDKYGWFDLAIGFAAVHNEDVFTVPITLHCSDGEKSGCTKQPSMAQIRSALNACPTRNSNFGSVDFDSDACYSAGYACALHPDAPNCGWNSGAPMQRAQRKWGGHNASGKDVYQCAGPIKDDWYGQCATLNRGVKDLFADKDPSTYYHETQDGVPLYNEYSKWVHDLCGDNNSAFPDDDYAGHAAALLCFGALTVDFCSGNGPPSQCDVDWGSCQPSLPNFGTCRDHLLYTMNREAKSCLDALSEVRNQCSACSGCGASDCGSIV